MPGDFEVLVGPAFRAVSLWLTARPYVVNEASPTPLTLSFSMTEEA
jgi:hypothetical protein